MKSSNSRLLAGGLDTGFLCAAGLDEPDTAANALGLTIPLGFLQRADEVME